MARTAPAIGRPHDALRRAVDAHEAIGDPAAHAAAIAEAETRREETETRKRSRRAQPRTEGGTFK
jgi:hypothetical protein